MASPVAQGDSFRPSSSSSLHGPDPQNPPQFINPNATQISPPGSRAGRRSGSHSISMLPGAMGPPMQPQLHRTVSAGMLEKPTFTSNMMGAMSSYVPRRSMYDPLYRNGPTPIAQPNAPPPAPQPPMAEPFPQLIAGLQPRPVSPSGYPINDKALPQQLVEWRVEYEEKGGFWGKIANYYIKKHESSASVYRSPFAPKPESSAHKFAEAYYQSLVTEDQAKIEDFKVNGMRN